jgi:hypothetical protein
MGNGGLLESIIFPRIAREIRFIRLIVSAVVEGGTQVKQLLWRSAALLALPWTGGAQDQFVVNLRTTSNVCIVQRTTDRPQLGNRHLGPYATEADATAAMCRDVDNSFSDQSKCWTVTPPGACDQRKKK